MQNATTVVRYTGMYKFRQGKHFHIVWSPDTIDWVRHPTRDAAEESAKVFVRRGETYDIREFDDETCPKCGPPRRMPSSLTLQMA